MSVLKTKRCGRCKREFPLMFFTKDKNKKDGLAFYCKNCISIDGRKRRATASGRYDLIKGRQNFFHKNQDSRSKPFNLSREDFVEWYDSQPKQCVYCGIEEKNLPLFGKKYNIRTKKLTVDCKDNSLGYVVDNLILACDKCNIIKQNVFTYEEMLEIGQKYIRPKWEELLNESTKGDNHE